MKRAGKECPRCGGEADAGLDRSSPAARALDGALGSALSAAVPAPSPSLTPLVERLAYEALTLPRDPDAGSPYGVKVRELAAACGEAGLDIQMVYGVALDRMKSDRPPFWVVQLYDREGYYGSVTGPDPASVRESARARCDRVRSLIAATLPFLGSWTSAGVRDVTAPPDVRDAFSALEGRQGSEE